MKKSSFHVYHVSMLGSMLHYLKSSGVSLDNLTRGTMIRNFDPNSEILASYVINSTFRDKHILEFIEYNISYDSDIQKAKKIIREVAEEHALSVDKRTVKQKNENAPIVEVRLMNFGDFAITLRALVWVKDAADARKIRWILNEAVKEKFDKEGIEIPFPYHNLVFKNQVNTNIIDKPN